MKLSNLILAVVSGTTFIFGCIDTSNDHSIDATIEKIAAADSMALLLKKCPAHYYASKGRRNSEFVNFEEVCRENPNKCFRQCQRGNASHCQSLAYILQNDLDESENYSDILFAQSCALGISSGCTNRAAGVSHKTGSTLV